jgi:hypothetical protein
VLKSSALLDDGIRQMFLQVRPDNWPWGWLNDGNIRLNRVAAPGQSLTLIPTRGESTVQYELGLVSRGVLTPLQVLQVRALDWQRPVFSDFRCDLFRMGQARVQQPGFKLGKLPTGATNQDMMGLLYTELLRRPDGSELLPPVSPADEIIALAIAGPDAFAAIMSARPITLEAFGDFIDAYAQSVSDAPRSSFMLERTRRACRLQSHPASPIVRDLQCP